jgi:hypothetical protein
VAGGGGGDGKVKDQESELRHGLLVAERVSNRARTSRIFCQVSAGKSSGGRMGPGAIAFTKMPRLAYSTAMARVNAATAALLT